MMRNRNQNTDPESENIDPTEAIIDAQTLDETISGLSKTIERIENDINGLYERFQVRMASCGSLLMVWTLDQQLHDEAASDEIGEHLHRQEGRHQALVF